MNFGVLSLPNPTWVVGTVGYYAAPEYVQTGKLTAKSDVWSFGVVLYELITGRRAVERNLPRAQQKLLEWVRLEEISPYYRPTAQRGNFCIKSAQLRNSGLANKCLMKQPKSRPKMSEVVAMLGIIIIQTSLPQEEDSCETDKEIDDVKEEILDKVESSKQETHLRKSVFDFREMVSLRNRSIGKLDWRNWTPSVVRTWLIVMTGVFMRWMTRLLFF